MDKLANFTNLSKEALQFTQELPPFKSLVWMGFLVDEYIAM